MLCFIYMLNVPLCQSCLRLTDVHTVESFMGLTDHYVSLSSLFCSVLSVYAMYCSLDVMDVHGTSP